MVAAALVAAATAPAHAWRTDFNGPPGPAPWPWATVACPLASGQITQRCPAHNARVTGNGSLRLAASPSNGALIQTRTLVRAPFTVRVRVRMPRARGYWPTVWLTREDGSTRDLAELDMEPRTGIPGVAACYQHLWHRAPDGAHTAVGGRVTGRVRLWRWHVWQITATATGTRYTVDGRPCLTAAPVTGAYRIHVQTIGGLPGTWVAGCNMPVIPCGLRGARRPAASRVDWVEVRPAR